MIAVRAILFDAGGTLIHLDGERVCRAAEVAFDADAFRRAEAAAVATIRAWVRAHPASTDSERMPLYLDTMLLGLGLGDSAARDAAAVRVAGEHRRANLWSRAGEGAAEVLASLRDRGYRSAVVSNADGRVRGLLAEAGLADFFEFVVDSAEVGVEKPDPRIFRTATGRLGLRPEECAYVGDIYEIDVLGAERAGLRSVLIGDAPAPEGVTRIPDLRSLLTLLPDRLA